MHTIRDRLTLKADIYLWRRRNTCADRELLLPPLYDDMVQQNAASFREPIWLGRLGGARDLG